MTGEREKPRQPPRDLAAMDVREKLAGRVNADLAKKEHTTLVEAGHMAALAADKLHQGIRPYVRWREWGGPLH